MSEAFFPQSPSVTHNIVELYDVIVIKKSNSATGKVR